MRTRNLISVILALGLAITACKLPLSPPKVDVAAASTAVQQTVEAFEAAGGAAEQSPTAPEATQASPAETPLPPAQTDTPVPPSPTAGVEGCVDRAGFVADVTVPDGTPFSPGQAFTKTWRLKNTGTCTWTSSYALVFDHGDQLGGPAAVPLSGSVAPGATVDLSVNLTAPASVGTYQGFWKLRNNSNVLFGIGGGGTTAFWVKIIVPATPTPTPTLGFILIPTIVVVHFPVTITRDAGDSGSVRSNGSVLGVENVGDTSANDGSQAFLSFDISGIPAGSTIDSVKVDFTDYDTLGDPFGSLGCLRGYVQNYGSLDSSDYHHGGASGAILRWCNSGQLSTAETDDDVKSALQAQVGSSAFQLRLQFNETESDNDGVADMVRFGDAKLIVSYTAP